MIGATTTLQAREPSSRHRAGVDAAREPGRTGEVAQPEKG